MTLPAMSVMLNYFAFGATIVILILSILSVNLKERVHLWFCLNVACLFISFVSDIVIALIMGQTGSTINMAIRILDCISYSASGLQIIAFAWYLYEYFCLRTTVSKKLFICLSVVGAATILMSVTSFFTGLYTQLDESNNYIRQSTFWISEISFVLAVLVCLVIVYQYAKFLGRREIVSLILYAIVPLPCYILEVMIPNFYISLFGATITITLIYVNLQMELNHQMQQKEVELTENRIAITLSQIQPHFLFNALNSIDSLIFLSPEDAHKAVIDFSKYLRGNLDSLTQRELVLFTRELEHTRQYLRLEEMRFGGRLKVEYDIQSEDFMLPVMSLQPIVENAVRYGVTKKRNGGTVWIYTEEKEQSYCITVTDDGVGFEPEIKVQDDRSHIGISNVRSRLEAMCGGQLTIKSLVGEGTTAVIEIPKREETYNEHYCRRR